MIRMAHEHPHQVTIYGAGPLTNIAVAIELDPHFAEMAKELVIVMVNLFFNGFHRRAKSGV